MSIKTFGVITFGIFQILHDLDLVHPGDFQDEGLHHLLCHRLDVWRQVVLSGGGAARCSKDGENDLEQTHSFHKTYLAYNSPISQKFS